MICRRCEIHELTDYDYCENCTLREDLQYAIMDGVITSEDAAELFNEKTGEKW